MLKTRLGDLMNTITVTLGAPPIVFVSAQTRLEIQVEQ